VNGNSLFQTSKATPGRLETNEETSDLKKSAKNRGKSDSLKSVGPVVRTLWRVAGSGAKAPPLAARPERKKPRSQTLVPHGSRKRGEGKTCRHTHIEKERTGSGLSDAKKEVMN